MKTDGEDLLEEKIWQLLKSKDCEMNMLGVLLFHECIFSSWKGDTLNGTDIHQIECTKARFNVYERRKKRKLFGHDRF